MLNKQGMHNLQASQIVTLQQREQFVLDLLIEGQSIEYIAKIIDRDTYFVKIISEFAIENYVPPWVKQKVQKLGEK